MPSIIITLFKSLSHTSLVLYEIFNAGFFLAANEFFKAEGHDTIVIATDGSQILDNDILEEIILEKNVLMILRPGEEWVSAEQAKILTENRKDVLTYVDADEILNEQSSLPYSFADLNDSATFTIVELPEKPSTSTAQVVSTITPGYFSIPWENIPNEIHVHMLNSESLPSQKYAQFVQYIVERVREHDKYTKKKGFETIAKEIVERYPNTFKDFDEDGQVIGEGHLSLLMKLINRNAYQNRPFKQQFAEQNLKKEPSRSKIIMQTSSGTSNWQPNLDGNMDYASMKTDLLRFSKDPRSDRNKAINTFKESFANQRYVINSCSGIAKFLEEWPINREYDFLMLHFLLLTNIENTDYAQAFTNKLIKLRNYLDTQKPKSKPNCNTRKGLDLPDEAKVVYKLANYFNENPEMLLVPYPVRFLLFSNIYKFSLVLSVLFPERDQKR